VNAFFVVDTGFTASGPGDNTCFEFQRTGRCSKGDACRYSHAAPAGAAGGRAKPWLAAGAALVRGADGEVTLAAAASPSPAAPAPLERDDKAARRARRRERKEAKKARKDAKKGRSKEGKSDRGGRESRKRRRESGSGSSEEESEEESAPAEVAPLDAGAFFERNHEFALWLREGRSRDPALPKGTFFTALSAVAARAAFSEFVEAWNGRRLPRRFYDGGLVVTGRR